MEENSSRKTRGRAFPKGKSGNPAGRPKGARNRTTLAMEALLDGDAEALTRKAIKLGLEGDPIGLRLCLDRLLPPRRDRTVNFKLPRIYTGADAASAMAAIIAAVAAGDITPSEAAEITKLLERYAKLAEALDREIQTKVLAWARTESLKHLGILKDDFCDPDPILPKGWTPRVSAMRQFMMQMSDKEMNDLIRCVQDRRWDEVPPLFDARYMNGLEIFWFLGCSPEDLKKKEWEYRRATSGLPILSPNAAVLAEHDRFSKATAPPTDNSDAAGKAEGISENVSSENVSSTEVEHEADDADAPADSD